MKAYAVQLSRATMNTGTKAIAEIKPDTPLRLAVAAKMAFPDGSITASALRRESLRGRLVIERIAGKDYTTLANIERMRRLCQLERKESGSGSAPGEVTAAAAFAKPPGSFSTATSISPRDALRAKLQQQKANSRNTSRQSTARRARHGT